MFVGLQHVGKLLGIALPLLVDFLGCLSSACLYLVSGAEDMVEVRLPGLGALLLVARFEDCLI
jgi:hypothetical protein